MVFIFAITEILLNGLGEFVLQLLLLGCMVVDPSRKQQVLWKSAIGYAIFGTVVGGLSLLVFPESPVAGKILRVGNAVGSPIVSGLCMGALGAWRVRRGLLVLHIHSFSHGYLFALCFGLVRFWFANPG